MYSCEEAGRLSICWCLRVIHSLLQSVHSTVKVYRVQASIPAKRKSTRSTYLPTYLPTQSWYLPKIGTYHTQNGNRYVGKTSNQDMFLLQLVQKYFPTSSFFPDCPSARTTCVWCCPNTSRYCPPTNLLGPVTGT